MEPVALAGRAGGDSAGWVAFLLAAAIVGTLLHADLLLPLEPLLIGFIGLAVWVGISRPLTQANLLPRFFVLAYTLPFSIFVGYLFASDYDWMMTPHGRRIVSDPAIVREMTTLGVIGLLGLAAGFRLAADRRAGPDIRSRFGHALGMLPFGVVAAAGVLLSWLSAPPETIFQARYAFEQSDSLSTRLNFPAAKVVSYVILILLAVDIERDAVGQRRRLKLWVLGAVVAYIVTFLQLLRGDRESFALVVALAGIHLTTAPGPEGAYRALRRRARRLVLPAVALVGIFLFIGWARFALSGASAVVRPEVVAGYWLKTSTWTAVLWTVVGAVWEHRSGVLEYRLGGTYVDYLLSLPPGMITRGLGIERPFEAWRGIAWENPAGVSSGGLHAVIVPFKNFGALGVMGVLCAFGYLIGRIEIANARGGFLSRLVWGACLASGLHWFWYGDMPFIRAMTAALIAFLIYRLGLYVSTASALAPDA